MNDVAKIRQDDELPRSFLGEIWETLSAINLEGYTKQLKHANNATYLPWSNAWTLIMQRYPESSFKHSDPSERENKSVEVWCELTIRDGEKTAKRDMWLPVMDGKNNAIFDPSTRAISDTRMRCLVKCASLFGLGIHLYSGEDLPKMDTAPTLPHGAISEEQQLYLSDKLQKTGADVSAFCKFFSITTLEELPADKYNNAKALLEAKAKKAAEDD